MLGDHQFFVGVDADMRLSGVEIRGPSAGGIGRVVQRHAKLGELATQGLAHRDGVLADAGGENQGVHAAEHGYIGAGIFRHRVDETLDRRDRSPIHTLLQHSHAAADARLPRITTMRGAAMQG